MGICFTKTVYDKIPELRKWKNQFEDLQISEKVLIKLYHEFRIVDDDNSGTIQMSELFHHLNIVSTPYNERIFGLFDVDQSGFIDFAEFATALWNYCTLDKQTLAQFTFELYDNDQSGVIESSEVTQMLYDIYGKNFANSKHARVIEAKLTAIGNFTCSQAAFLDFCITHPALLFPAFEMQNTIEKKCLGVRFWKQVAGARSRSGPAKYMSVAKMTDIMAARSADTTTEESHQPSVALRPNLKVVTVAPRSRRRSSTSAEQANSISEAYLRQQKSEFEYMDPVLNPSRCASTTIKSSPYSSNGRRNSSTGPAARNFNTAGTPTKPKKVVVRTTRNTKVVRVAAVS